MPYVVMAGLKSFTTPCKTIIKMTLERALLAAISTLAAVVSFLYIQTLDRGKECERERVELTERMHKVESDMRNELKEIANEAYSHKLKSDSVASTLMYELLSINKDIKKLK